MALNLLLKRQAEIKTVAESLAPKFGKTSDANRKVNYFRKRLAELEELWNEFEANNGSIEDLIEITEERKAYDDGKHYEKVLEILEGAKKMYEDAFLEKFPDQQLKEKPDDDGGDGRPMSDEEEKNHHRVKRIYAVRGTLTTDLARKIQLRIDDMNTVIELEHELKKIETAQANLTVAYEDLLLLAQDEFDFEGLTLEHEDISNIADRVIITCKNKIVNLKEKKVCDPEAPKLQALKVPKFKGECQQWMPFLNLFNRVVRDNAKLTNVQKLQYLMDSLEGEPRKLIQHLDICDNNFHPALDILVRRYNDQRRIVNSHVDAILDLPTAADEPKGLKRIHDTIMESLYALKGQNISDDQLGETLIVRIIEKKLDAKTRQNFEDMLGEKRQIPKLDKLMSFMEERFISMETVGNEQGVRNIEKETINYQGKNKRGCVVCNSNHNIHQCAKFNKMSPYDRNEAVRKSALCRNCLKSHGGRCTLSANCNKCKGFHHVALHFEKKPDGGKTESRHDAQAHVGNAEKEEFDVLLATAIIRARNRDGEYVDLRALIDQGSTVSFISEEAVQRLKAPRRRDTTVITGIGAGEAETTKGSASICVKPRYPSSFETTIDTIILRKLTTYENAINQKWQHTRDLVLADPEYWKPGAIDIILGADVFSVIVLDGVLRGPMNTPVAQETVLGWILSGKVKRTGPKLEAVGLVSTSSLEKQLESFWEVEELKGDAIGKFSSEERLCEEFFRETTIRKEDGRYVTRLPFKEKENGFGKSRHIAVATLLQMERRFKRDPHLKSEYSKCINEYLDLDHMQLAKESDEELMTFKGGEKQYECYYLPHHAVFKATSTTTKLRVVFNASQKSSNGNSLNDLMMVGPTIQDELMNILVRWRGHRIALAADIEKMYRQIGVDENDYNYQRIVWRNDESEPIRDYCLKRVTFGNAAAPFTAIRTVKQLAIDEHENYPKAAAATQSDFYVDDLMTGAHTTEEAIELQRQLRAMMKTGKLNLRKWASNELDVLEEIPEEDRELKSDIAINANTTLKMLGVQWEPTTDKFSYKLEIGAPRNQYTKRELVSEVARIFDPLGWLSPVVIMAKIRLQETWILGIGWDQRIPDQMTKEWNEFKSTLSGANIITLPRYIGLGHEEKKYELHGFSDASMKAYAAVVYLRSTAADGQIEIHLIAAKSRVAPTKTISLPRLELCGAVLLSQLMARVEKALRREFEMHAWTDSTITLAWITGDSHRWETFVANRVTKIRENLAGGNWHHVGTKDNPADMASRGLDATTLKNCDLWWQGPEWLRESNIEVSTRKFNTTMGMRKMAVLHTTHDSYYNEVIGRFSSLDRLKRVMAYCLRFVKRCRGECPSGYITVGEIKHASTALIKWAQSSDFGAEKLLLETRGRVEAKSGIASLNPLLDSEGVLRVGGRIQSENLSYSRRHPIILAYANKLVPLIVSDAHLKTLHGGNTLTLAYIRQQYWILKAKRAVKAVLRRCVKCVRYRAEVQQQQMGNLPIQRTTEARPFLFAGVDFCGPFDVKTSMGRNVKTVKGYIAVFICLSTKAIHLEAVGDLTSRSFMAALRRMTSRRGHVARLFSDNGTNFVGANKLIREEYRGFLKDYQDEITLELTRMNMEWHFIPPSAPNFGGLWEAGVKSVKHHLKRTVGDARLTYEELSTVLSQIEACLNSRPLCALTEDPNELVLTPAHFLIGETLLLRPEPDLSDKQSNRLRRWQLHQKIQQDFWRCWKDEYLSRLQQRTKWLNPSENLRKDDVVLVKDERTPSSVWPLGRITNTHSGTDGLVRVVDVKIGKKIFRRPISKICLLPVQEREDKGPPGRDAEDKGESASKEKHTRASNHCFSFTKTLMIIGLIICTIDQAIGSFDVQKLKQGPALYFEKIGRSAITEGEWNIVAYYDLKHYFDEFDRVSDGVNQWTQRCTDLDLQCDLLRQQFEHRMAIIRDKNELLTGHHGQRKKRAILAMAVGALVGGAAYHWLTAGESSSYASSITNLKTNQDHLRDLIQQQTSILEITGNIMKKNFETLSQEHMELRRDLNRIASAQNQIQASWGIQSASVQLALMLESYADIQNRVIDAITNFNGGRLHPTLIPVNQLREQLKLIQEHLPPNSALPGKVGDDLILHVFRTARVRIGFAEEKIIFRITVPVLKATPFWLWRVVAIPMLVDEEFLRIQPLNEYLLVDSQNSTYYDLEKNELKACTSDDDEIVCELHHPLHRFGAERGRCEMKFMRNEVPGEADCKVERLPAEETWIQLNNLRTWIFSMDRRRNYSIECEDYELSFSLGGMGLLTFRGNCSLTGDDIQISSNQLASRMTNGYVRAAALPSYQIDEDFLTKNQTNDMNVTSFEEFNKGMDRLREGSAIELLDISLPAWRVHIIYGAAILSIAIMGIILYWRLSTTIKKITGNSSGPGECTELQTVQ